MNDSPIEYEFSALREAENYQRALAEIFAPYLSGRVVEVGSGVGHMSAVLRNLPKVRSLLCVEPDPRFCEKLKMLFSVESVVNGTIKNVSGDEWDAVVNINVLEHIEDDLGELKKYRELLKKRRGYLCLFVPARMELYAPLDKDNGHVRRYAKKELREKLEQAGFEIERISYYNFIGYFAWWFSFCFLKQKTFNPRAVRFFDSYIFPPTHFLEEYFVRPPIGQSLLVVARAK
jgi:SAM-dependent methyltransferase